MIVDFNAQSTFYSLLGQNASHQVTSSVSERRREYERVAEVNLTLLHSSSDLR